MRKPTTLAISRWLCSYRIPPTHLEGGNVNIDQPYEVGQSGTDSPESVLVTRLPASSSSTVQPARNWEKR